MTTDERQALAAAYALGALETSEAQAFEGQLERDAELRALVQEYQEVSALLAAGVDAAGPPSELRDRILTRARGEAGKVIPVRPRRNVTPLAWAAAAAGLLLAGVQTLRIQQLSGRVDSLASDVRAAVERRDLLEARQTAVLDGNTTMYVMKPTATGDSAARFGAQLFWRRDRHTWLVHAFDLPKLAAGQVYQLWYVTSTAKISAGVFEVDSEGHGIALVSVPPEASQSIVAAMSVEPGPSGSPQPTGPIVMAGSVAEN